MPTNEMKKPEEKTESGDDQPSLEDVRAAFEAARLRVKPLAKRERESERVPGELLNLRLKSNGWFGPKLP
jgi:hypothetical protein